MNARYIHITAILLSHAMATAPAVAQTGVRTVEAPADVECLNTTSRHDLVTQGRARLSKERRRQRDLALFLALSGDMEMQARLALYARELRQQLACKEAAADKTKVNESLLEDIRNTRETIDWFERYRDEYRRRELERHQDPLDISEPGYSQYPG